MKILTVIGTRPQFIKLIPELDTVLVDTGQHYDDNMSGDFFSELGIKKPDYSLGATNLLRMISGLLPVVKKEKPELIIVYGDTRSTLAGARVAKKLSIKLAHIEAGVRCWDSGLEEENIRKEVDHLSDYLFCPTQQAVENLRNEGIFKNIYFVGDVLYDRFLQFRSRERYVFLTIHRQENANREKIQEIINSLVNHKKVVFPVHPRTKKCLPEKIPHNIIISEPIGYRKTLHYIQNSYLVVTDSGGVQREAFWCGTPCQVIRKKNEWQESNHNPYGEGDAGKKIVGILKEEGFCG